MGREGAAVTRDTCGTDCKVCPQAKVLVVWETRGADQEGTSSWGSSGPQFELRGKNEDRRLAPRKRTGTLAGLTTDN